MMEESYTIRVTDNDPRIKVKMSPEMLAEVKKRAHQNGRDLNIELMMRLARTLERDNYRDEIDDLFVRIFFVNDDNQAVT